MRLLAVWNSCPHTTHVFRYPLLSGSFLMPLFSFAFTYSMISISYGSRLFLIRVFIMENKNPRLFSRGFIITFRHWHVPPCFHGFMMPACFAYAPIYLSNPFHCVVCVCSELFCFNASNCVFIESN